VVEELTEEADKILGLQMVMKHYSGRDAWEFETRHLKNVRVWRIRVDQISGKQSKDKITAT